MKKHLLALATLAALSAPAYAGSCVALEYQEMKDMSVNDLVTEACKADAENDDNFQKIMKNLYRRDAPKPFPTADHDLDQCTGQRDRMTRVLNSKGVTEKLPTLCKQQAAGQTITAPAEAK